MRFTFRCVARQQRVRAWNAALNKCRFIVRMVKVYRKVRSWMQVFREGMGVHRMGGAVSSDKLGVSLTFEFPYHAIAHVDLFQKPCKTQSAEDTLSVFSGRKSV